VLWASLTGGVALGVYTGVLLGSLAARPLWNSAVLGPLFLVSGLSTAAALLLLFGPRESDQRSLLRFDVAAIVAELVLLALFLIDLATGPATAREAAGLLFGGSFTAPFWALVVGGGLLVPLFMDLAEIRRGLAPTVVSAVLVLAGGLSLRIILTAAGQVSGFDVP
jgi:formate-dependent nitrite reductase membrane component NrfD